MMDESSFLEMLMKLTKFYVGDTTIAKVIEVNPNEIIVDCLYMYYNYTKKRPILPAIIKRDSILQFVSVGDELVGRVVKVTKGNEFLHLSLYNKSDCRTLRNAALIVDSILVKIHGTIYFKGIITSDINIVLRSILRMFIELLMKKQFAQKVLSFMENLC